MRHRLVIANAAISFFLKWILELSAFSGLPSVNIAINKFRQLFVQVVVKILFSVIEDLCLIIFRQYVMCYSYHKKEIKNTNYAKPLSRSLPASTYVTV